MTKDEEKGYIERVLAGDESAYEPLVTENQTKVYRLALRILKNEADAEDAAQEAFLKAYTSLADFRGDSRFSVWLYRLTNNICIDMLRKNTRAVIVSLQTEDDDGEETEIAIPDERYSPERLAERAADRDAVAALLAEVPDEHPLTGVLHTAGVLDDEALSRMHAWTGVAVHEIYGSTETGVVASRRHDAGRMNPAWTLIDEGGLEETEQGWRLASPLLPQGSILLDDRLEMSSDKVFRLLGRRDRIVKIGEIRLSLTEIERVVKEALGLEIRALSVKQAGRTVIGAVVCERTSPGWRGRCPNRIETTAALAGRLNPLARPRLWRHVADWPTDAQGKVVVPMLAELFEHKETTHG